MSYCTYSDVAAEFKNITFSASSSITDTEVTEFIAQADAYIDSRIGLKYQVPITGSASLKIVKRLSIWLVSARIKEILTVKLGQPIGEQETRSGDLNQMANDELSLIVKGQMTLSDSDLVSSADGVRSYAVDEDLEYEFSITDDNW